MRLGTSPASSPDPVSTNRSASLADHERGAAGASATGAESVATMTLVDADGRTTSAESARQRRYEELLRSAPPPAPAAQPRRESSFLDRVMTPIANALGIGKEKPPAAAVTRPDPRTAARPVSPSSTPSTTAAATEAETTTAPEADDETDIAPPQLFSAEFLPNEIRDGEETLFAAFIRDNLSGVKSVSGVITSPSGSMQGFSSTREGETDRFVARIKVPKDAPEGLWSVKYVTLTDNASNSVHLNQAAGALPATANFRVVSAGSDASGPQLEAVWLDRPAMRAGERNTVFVRARDDKAGVSLVSGVFVSPSRAARIGFGCRLGAGDTWECGFAPPACLDCGAWRLEQIQLQDKAQNLMTFRQDHTVVAGVTVDITGDRCDAAPPVITALSLEPSVVSNARASVITVHATVMDDGCGVASLSGQAIPPGGIGGQRRYISFQPQSDGSFTGTLEIPQFAAKGRWQISWIQALDKGHNLRAYPATEPVIARATFVVE